MILVELFYVIRVETYNSCCKPRKFNIRSSVSSHLLLPLAFFKRQLLLKILAKQMNLTAIIKYLGLGKRTGCNSTE